MDQVKSAYPELSIMRWIEEGCQTAPDRCLLATVDACFAYGEVGQWTISLAQYFAKELGLGAGSTVVLCAPNIVHVLVVLSAAQLLDVRVALFPPATGTAEFERAVGLVGPQLIISSDPCRFGEARGVITDVRCMLTEGRDVGAPSVDEAMRRPIAGEVAFPRASANAPIIVFTSGSTGVPKAIVNRASSFALNGLALRKWLGVTSDDVVYLPVPLVHVFGIVGMYLTLVSQATFTTSPKYDAEEACALIEAMEATVHLGVPTNFIRELKCNEDERWNLDSLRAGLVAGADCPAFVIEEFEKRYGCIVMQSYGMSETAATLTVTPLEYDTAERAATLGFCIDGAQAKTDPDTGEIMCKSASMMEGILQPNGSTVLELDDGWFRTGDVGRIDERGQISMTGRLKHVIVRGGINIFPSEIELLYKQCDDVEECCAAAVEDEELGHRICLGVVLRDGSTMTAEDLRFYARGRIDKGKIPDMVTIVDALPYLDNGKIDRGSFAQQVQLGSKA